MRTGRHIHREIYRGLKGYSLALGVSLVFYLFNIHRLQGASQHLNYILLAWMYGSVIFTCIWSIYAFQAAILRFRNRPVKFSRATSIFFSFSGTAIGLALSLYFDALITGDPFTLGRFWESLLVGLFIALMFQFYHAYKESSAENLILKAAKAEADLHVLRNQMQPHFLFNSLNSLLALIEQDPATAGHATQKLADLYRLILECSKDQLSPLSRELEIAGLYLEIEKVRFGERLTFELPSLAAAQAELRVPSLVLQTLVENAVKHGISKAMGGGKIVVGLLPEGRGLRVTVENTGASLQHANGSGTGLRNTKERLTLAFGSAHEFALASTSSGATRASFIIPEPS